MSTAAAASPAQVGLSLSTFLSIQQWLARSHRPPTKTPSSECSACSLVSQPGPPPDAALPPHQLRAVAHFYSDSSEPFVFAGPPAKPTSFQAALCVEQGSIRVALAHHEPSSKQLSIECFSIVLQAITSQPSVEALDGVPSLLLTFPYVILVFSSRVDGAPKEHEVSASSQSRTLPSVCNKIMRLYAASRHIRSATSEYDRLFEQTDRAMDWSNEDVLPSKLDSFLLNGCAQVMPPPFPFHMDEMEHLIKGNAPEAHHRFVHSFVELGAAQHRLLKQSSQLVELTKPRSERDDLLTQAQITTRRERKNQQGRTNEAAAAD